MRKNSILAGAILAVLVGFGSLGETEDVKSEESVQSIVCSTPTVDPSITSIYWHNGTVGGHYYKKSDGTTFGHQSMTYTQVASSCAVLAPPPEGN